MYVSPTIIRDLRQKLEDTKYLIQDYQVAINMTKAFLGTNWYHIHHLDSLKSVEYYQQKINELEVQVVEIKAEIASMV